MANIMFVTWDGGGNVPPALGIAAELRRRGHRVRFLGHRQQADAIAGAGLDFRPYAHARPWDSASVSPGLPALLHVTGVWADPGIGEDLLSAIREEPADLLVVDNLLFGALDAAARSDVQVAVLMHSFYAYMRQMESWRGGPAALLTRLRGHRPRQLWSAADLVLVTTLRELDPAGQQALPPNVLYTGPVWQGEPAAPGRRADPAEPFVLVSLSTQNFPGQVKALQRILDALAGLPLRALVTTGPAVDPGRLAPPPNAEVHRFVPHAEVLPRASLLVGHGGHATTLAALAHGRPLVVMPMFPIDQPMMGRVLKARGAARVVSKRASADRIRDAIQDVLRNPAYRDAAERLGAAIRQRDGAVAAADRLDALMARPPDRSRRSRAGEMGQASR